MIMIDSWGTVHYRFTFTTNDIRTRHRAEEPAVQRQLSHRLEPASRHCLDPRRQSYCNRGTGTILDLYSDTQCVFCETVLYCRKSNDTNSRFTAESVKTV